MYLSQSKAAKLAGVSRGTIANRLDDGKLSKTPEGIELSELMRCFPEITEHDIEDVIKGGSKRELVNNSPGTLSTDEDFLKSRLEAADKQADWFREMVEQQNDQLAEKERKLAEMATKLDDKDRQIMVMSDKIVALLPAPEAIQPRKKFLGFF